MKKIKSLSKITSNLIKHLLLSGFFICLIVDVGAKEIFVDISNTGVQDGTFNNGYQTIQQAADIASSGDIITVRAGVYREEVNIPINNLTFQVYNNDKVIINGTEKLTSWNLESGTTFKTNSMIWDCDPFDGANQLFADGVMIELARWPKQTSLDIVKPTDGIATSVSYSGNYIIITDNNFNEPDNRWTGAEVWLNTSGNGHDGEGWSGTVVSTNQASHTITVDYRMPPLPANQPWGFTTNSEYFIFNPTAAGVAATGGVDALLGPGEWWKDGSNLFVKMPNENQPGDAVAITNVVESKKRLFAFIPKSPYVNCSNITIKHFTLFATSITTDRSYNTRISIKPGFGPFSPTIIEDAHNIVIDSVTAKYVSHFTNQQGDWQNQWTGRSGFIISGINNTVKNCTFQYSASSAISIIGKGNKILNCVITDANYRNTNSAAINSGFISYDSEIGYNVISNTPMQAIKTDGFKNSTVANRGVARIHHNRIYNFMRRGYDSGAIDEVAVDGQYVRIDHNIIYNTLPDAINGAGRYGLYFDFGGDPAFECQARYIIDHNIIYNVDVSMQTNCARNLLIYNNVLLSINPDCVMSNGAGNENSKGYGFEDTIQNNIMSGLPNIWDNGVAGMSQAYIKNNIAYKTNKTYKPAIVSGNTLYNTPAEVLALFVDPTSHNYKLKSTATEAIDKGISFEPFNDPINNNIVDIGAIEYNNSAWSVGPTDFTSPIIMPNGGEFNDSIVVSLSSERTDVTIRYTTNGKNPDISSAEYTGAFSIKDTVFLKTRGFHIDGTFSEISAANFNVTPRNLPLRPNENPADILPGLNYEYYTWSPSLNLTNLPNLDTWIPVSNDTVSFVSLYKPHSYENFAVKFSGYIEVPVDGVYTFFTSSDDASKLYIGETLVVNNDFIYAPVTERSGMIGLKAGLHPIKIEYLQVSTGSDLKVYYKGPTIGKSPILLESMWHTSYVSRVSKVVIEPNGGKFYNSIKVALTSATVDDTIYYTLNGTIPTTASNVYDGEITISSNVELNAIGVKSGLENSLLATANFTSSVADVQISIAGKIITLTCETPGARIYYTLDESEPDNNSTKYSVPFEFTSQATIKAIAYKDGLTESNVTTKMAIIIQTAFDHFDYESGINISKMGTNSDGWASAWVKQSGKAIVTSPNIGTDTIGGAMSTQVFNSQAEYYRTFNEPWAMNGKTYWLRFAFQRNVTNPSSPSKWGGLSVYDKNQEILFIGAPWERSLIGFDGNPSEPEHFTSVSDLDESNILVKLNTAADGNGTAYMWIDYDEDTEPSVVTSVASQKFPRNDAGGPTSNTSFNKIRVASDASNSFSWDGIRLANIYFNSRTFPPITDSIPDSTQISVTLPELSDIVIYPNPVTNYNVTVNLGNIKNEHVIFYLYDNLGNLVYQKSTHGSSKTNLNLPGNLSKGFYILRIYCEEKIYDHKLVVE